MADRRPRREEANAVEGMVVVWRKVVNGCVACRLQALRPWVCLAGQGLASGVALSPAWLAAVSGDGAPVAASAVS